VWGSGFTTEVAKIQGDSAEIAPTLNVKLWDPVVVVTGGGGVLLSFYLNPLFESIWTFEKNFEFSPKNLAWVE
jgi:hypothetical protein